MFLAIKAASMRWKVFFGSLTAAWLALLGVVVHTHAFASGPDSALPVLAGYLWLMAGLFAMGALFCVYAALHSRPNLLKVYAATLFVAITILLAFLIARAAMTGEDSSPMTYGQAVIKIERCEVSNLEKVDQSVMITLNQGGPARKVLDAPGVNELPALFINSKC